LQPRTIGDGFVRLTLPARLGPLTQEHSTGGKRRFGGISSASDERLRQLLLLAATAVTRHALRVSLVSGSYSVREKKELWVWFTFFRPWWVEQLMQGPSGEELSADDGEDDGGGLAECVSGLGEAGQQIGESGLWRSGCGRRSRRFP
jgi:hypothetical protein